jgi:predicted RND superfamily exporter protein
MPKANKPEPKPGTQKPANQQQTTAKTQKSASGQGQASEQQKNTVAAGTPAPARPSTPPANRSKQSSKKRKPAIGGTAVPGAKATIPKEIPTGGPPQDRPELYNRDARRRMQHMGAGPYAEKAPVPARRRFEKRLEERKKRQQEVKKTVVTKGPSTNVKIGNKNTYFMLAVLGIVVLIIVIALIIRHPF